MQAVTAACLCGHPCIAHHVQLATAPVLAPWTVVLLPGWSGRLYQLFSSEVLQAWQTDGTEAQAQDRYTGLW